MRLYEPPAKEFFRLPNSIFHVPLDATQFKLYAYLVCCSGSKEYCWPTHKKIIQDTGIKKSSLQKAIKVLVKRKLIAMYKHRNPYGYSNNEYHLLSLDNPEIYRDLDSLVVGTRKQFEDQRLQLTVIIAKEVSGICLFKMRRYSQSFRLGVRFAYSQCCRIAFAFGQRVDSEPAAIRPCSRRISASMCS